MFRDRHFNFMRGDLEHVLYSELHNEVELRFGTTTDAVHEDDERLRVALSDGSNLGVRPASGR